MLVNSCNSCLQLRWTDGLICFAKKVVHLINHHQDCEGFKTSTWATHPSWINAGLLDLVRHFGILTLYLNLWLYFVITSWLTADVFNMNYWKTWHVNLCPYFSHFCLHNYYGFAQAHRTKLTHFCLLIRRAMCQGHSFAGITLQKKESWRGAHLEDNKRISLNMISVRKLACQSLQACARVNCFRKFSASSTALLQVSCLRQDQWMS